MLPNYHIFKAPSLPLLFLAQGLATPSKSEGQPQCEVSLVYPPACQSAASNPLPLRSPTSRPGGLLLLRRGGGAAAARGGVFAPRAVAVYKQIRCSLLMGRPGTRRAEQTARRRGPTPDASHLETTGPTEQQEEVTDWDQTAAAAASADRAAAAGRRELCLSLRRRAPRHRPRSLRQS